MSEKKHVPAIDFVKAVQSSETADEAVAKLIEQGFKITKASLQARASKYRQPEYKKIDLVKDGKIVFQTDADGKLTDKPVQVDYKDENGNKVIVREAIPLKKFARGGAPKLASQMDDLLAAIAEANGDN